MKHITIDDATVQLRIIITKNHDKELVSDHTFFVSMSLPMCIEIQPECNDCMRYTPHQVEIQVVRVST